MSGIHREPRGDEPQGRSSAGGHASRGGFALIEMAIAVSILVIGLVTLLSATSGMHRLRHQNRDRSVAQNGMRTMAERIHARSYGLTGDPATWSSRLIGIFGPGGSFGDTFEVQGLNLPLGAQTLGTIQIVTDETATDQALGAQLGMPRDLDGDGLVASTDVRQGARLLPVILRLRWRGQSGVSSLTHAFYVLGY